MTAKEFLEQQAQRLGFTVFEAFDKDFDMRPTIGCLRKRATISVPHQRRFYDQEGTNLEAQGSA